MRELSICWNCDKVQKVGLALMLEQDMGRNVEYEYCDCPEMIRPQRNIDEYLIKQEERMREVREKYKNETN